MTQGIGLGTAERSEPDVVEFSAGEVEDLEALYEELRGVAGIRVEAIPAPIEEGHQGSMLEFLTVACSGGAITVALQIVRRLVESRGRGFVLKIRCGKDSLELTGKNVDELLPMVKELMGGS